MWISFPGTYDQTLFKNYGQVVPETWGDLRNLPPSVERCTDRRRRQAAEWWTDWRAWITERRYAALEGARSRDPVTGSVDGVLGRPVCPWR
jgi:hypothetical protein